jgi:hypothetical protein
MLEPFNALARRNAKPKDSILISKPSSPLIALPSALPSALRNGHFFVALVALSDFLSEALNGLLANVHFRVGTTYTAFTVSTWLSRSIIIVILLTLLMVMLRP